MSNNRTILISSNYAWTIFNFRLPLIKSLKANGYRVEVITQYDGFENEIRKFADKVHPLFISRKGINPILDSLSFLNFLICLIKVKPIYFLPFTIKPVIYGCLAANLLRVKSIATITGLGTAFINNNWITFLVKKLYLISFRSVAKVFFQNSEDAELFTHNGLVRSEKVHVIPGSGIDTAKFYRPGSLPQGDPVFLLISRMIWDKGIGEFVEAARAIKKYNAAARFQLLGPLGIENRTAISQQKVNEWVEEGVIEYLGSTDDVRPYILQSNCVVLPSYREGMSRVLLEALSMSTPIITTNVPGCRELVDNKINGLICEPRNARDLENKMIDYLSLCSNLRSEMGQNGRAMVIKRYNIDVVCDQYITELRKLVSNTFE